MSDEIGHYCGIALIRLRKPLAYYSEKYGTPLLSSTLDWPSFYKV
jgi:hypothetical protein